MDEPLWIDAHAPDLDDIPQPDVREYLVRVANEPINLVLHGPPGSGKTAAVRALARAAHDDPENDLVEINVADFFGQTKTEIRNDPRFTSFLSGRSSLSKGDMINHVLKETASYPPVSGAYKTIVLDNAEAIREDFQQALRRVMERYHEATQFIIVTRQPTKLIPAIRSRCVPIAVRSPTAEEVCRVLESILDAEDVSHDPDGVSYVASYAEGDLRNAILSAQTVVESEGQLTQKAAYEVLREVGLDDRLEEVLDNAEAGEFTDARSILDELLIDEGYSGSLVLAELLRVARSRAHTPVESAELSRLAGEIDVDLVTGTNDRLHLAHFVAELGAE